MLFKIIFIKQKKNTSCFMEFLKKYTSHEEYEVDKTPNVSLCVENNEKHLHYTKKKFDDEYLTFEALESGTFTLTIGSAVTTGDVVSVSYSLDNGETWTTTNNVQGQRVVITTPTIQSGGLVMWKGNNRVMSSNASGTIQYMSCIFSSSGYYSVRGNIMSLLYGDNFKNETSLVGKIFSFRNLFSGSSKLKSAKNLSLAATTLASYCYYYMFQGCTSLTVAPELPATTLTQSCYQYMFSNCTNLTAAPALPATTLANSCYSNMFNGCKSLTTAPNLPATTLADSCYYYMFYNCTSLTTAPSILPATTLANDCYHQMFNNCKSLTVAPELPATTLVYQCYYYMFANCTTLTTAPELPATTLASYCYSHMFYGCNKLKYIKCMIEHPIRSYMSEWVNGVATNGVFVGSPSSTWYEGTSGVPKGWKNNVQQLPSYDSNETIRIWIDDFSNGEEYVLDNGWDNINDYFDDYFETPSDFGGKPYEYTGEMIEWNGDEYYIWVFNDGAVEDNDLPDNCKYILTDTIDFQELDEMSVSYNYNNRICPYVAMLVDDLSTYEDGQDSDRFLVLVEDIS